MVMRHARYDITAYRNNGEVFGVWDAVGCGGEARSRFDWHRS